MSSIPDSAPETGATATATLRLQGLLDNHEAQFWALQALGWGGWVLATTISWTFWGEDDFFPALAVMGVAGAMLSTGLRHIYRALWHRPIVDRAFYAVLASYAAALVWQASKNGFAIWYFPGWELKGGSLMSLFNGVLGSFYIMLCWSGLYFGLKTFQTLQLERARFLKVSAMAHQAQLKMLRYQLNPHFLFNTLNAVSTLIMSGDNDTANGMVTRLGKFLRYSLDSEPTQKVDLQQEVEALRLYLDIEQVRFDERLRFEVDLADDAGKALIPSLLLQPLVENAIKYAIARNEDGGTIRIAARTFGGELLISVSDDGPGIPGLDGDALPASSNGAHGGVGLANTRERLREIYAERHGFRVHNVEPHGLQVDLRLPLETAHG